DLAFLIHDHVTPADLGLERLDLGAQAAVGFEKFTLHDRALPLTGVRRSTTTSVARTLIHRIARSTHNVMVITTTATRCGHVLVRAAKLLLRWQLNQGLTNKHIARFLRSDGAIVHPTTGSQREPIESDALIGRHITSSGLPVRLAIGALQQM